MTDYNGYELRSARDVDEEFVRRMPEFTDDFLKELRNRDGDSEEALRKLCYVHDLILKNRAIIATLEREMRARVLVALETRLT